MPSPIAHIAVGTLLAGKVKPSDATPLDRIKLVLVCLFFSMAPDLDIAVAAVMGDMGRYHNNMSHSPAFGILACLVLSPLAWWFLGRSWAWLRVFALITACYGLHLFMDWLTYGRGLMLAWPFSETRFRSPVLLFYGVRWSDGFTSARHFISVANELVFIGVLWLAGWWRRSRVAGRTPH